MHYSDRTCTGSILSKCDRDSTTLRVVIYYLRVTLLLLVLILIRASVCYPVAGCRVLTRRVASVSPIAREFCLRTLTGLFNVVQGETGIRVPSEHIVELNETPGEPPQIIPMLEPVVQVVTGFPISSSSCRRDKVVDFVPRGKSSAS